MSLLQNSNAVTPSGGYNIRNSCRFEKSTPSYLQKNFSTGSPGTIYTWSCWVKLGALGVGQNFLDAQVDGYNRTHIGTYSTTDALTIYNMGAGLTTSTLGTEAIFRDPSAWYHIVFVWDTTQSQTNRVKVYVNGVQQTLTVLESTSWPGASDTSVMTDDCQHAIAVTSSAFTGSPLSAYLAEMYFIDGTALLPSDFGETDEDTNQWIAKDAKNDLTFGTNGFYLKFQDSADFGNDSSGNGNDWTSGNLVATDQMIDTPQNSTGGNFCTLNPLDKKTVTLLEGNLQVNGGGGGQEVRGTIAKDTGKWYYEMYLEAQLDADIIVGVGNIAPTVIASVYAASVGYRSDGYKYLQSSTATTYAATWGVGDIIGVAMNLDDEEVTFYKNDATQGALSFTLGTNVFTPFCRPGASTGTGDELVFNFGQDSDFAGNKTGGASAADGNGNGSFYYSPPTGHLALCTNNLPDPSIALPGENFNVLTWTGDAAASRSITGLGFQADMMWSKIDGGHQHNLVDTVRGVDGLLISPDSTAAEDDGPGGIGPSQGWYDSLDSDGWSMTYGSATGWNVNKNGYAYVGWAWKAGGAPTATNVGGQTPTSGSVMINGSASTDALATASIYPKKISANTINGFSIISYTGDDASSATINHGLSETPELIIIKSRESAEGWYVGSSAPELSFTLSDYMQLNVDSGESSSDTIWNDTAPTASVFTVGTNDAVNNTDNFIAYCFHSVEGYLKVGGYTGNGVVDGPFIYTGFRPAYAMFKRINAAQSWLIFDDARSTYNEMDKTYRADTNAAQQSIYEIDMVSNGIKIRNAESIFNHNGGTYLLLAFADSPFKTARAR